MRHEVVEEEMQAQQNDTDRYRAIGNVKCREIRKVNEVHHIAVLEAVDDVPERTTELESHCDGEHAAAKNRFPEVIEEKDDHRDRERGQDCTVVLKHPEGCACVPDEAKAQQPRDDGEGSQVAIGSKPIKYDSLAELIERDYDQGQAG